MFFHKNKPDNYQDTSITKRLFRSIFAVFSLSIFVLGVTFFVKELYYFQDSTSLKLASPLLLKLGLDSNKIGEVAGTFGKRVTDTNLTVTPINPNSSIINPNSSVVTKPSIPVIKAQTKPTDKKSKLTFAVLGDIHNDKQNLQKAIELSIQNKVAFVVILGDLTDYGDLNELKALKQTLDSYGINYYVIPGDRDLGQSVDNGDKTGLTNFFNVFGADFHAFKYEDINFVALNNSPNFSKISDTNLYKTQQAIVTSDFLFLSQPIYHTNNKVMGVFENEEIKYLREQGLELLKSVQNSKLKAVIAAEHHASSELSDPQNSTLKHIVVGAVSSQINGKPQKYLQSPRFNIFTVYQDNSFFYEELTL